MLEANLDSTIRKIDCEIRLIDIKDFNSFVTETCTLISEKPYKRILYLPKNKHLHFYFSAPYSGFSLRHFRLVPLTKNFASSRMLKKLLALHPLYKSTSQKLKYKKNTPNLDEIYQNYKEIFDSNFISGNYLLHIEKFRLMDKIPLKISHPAVNTPLFSIILPCYNTKPAHLIDCINSVKNQCIDQWELCIVDDASTDPRVRATLRQFQESDPRIKVTLRDQNGHISQASNSALEIATGPWLVLLDHDDLLAENALYLTAQAIENNPELQLIYSDEDKIDEDGERSAHYFKSDWNPDLFLSQNMISHLGVYRTDLVRAVGGFRVGYEGSQDYDLALRCIERIRADQIHHIPRVLYHWRIHPESTAHDLAAKPYAITAGERALNDHLKRIGSEAWAEAVSEGYRVHYPLPSPLPLVSLIIPTRNGLNLLKQCIDSIFEKTAYANYEILVVDNGSDDRATLRYLKRLESDERVRVIRDDRPFNYSALNNNAVAKARGEIIGLINNDIEVITPEWLSEIVSHAVRPEVGAVGARLWYSDDTIQHAGIILGMMGFAGHVHRYLPRGNPGYCGRAALTQSFSAVTGACLLVRKSLYEQVGGLSEVDLQVACNDVDFCLKLREAGYRNIWTPYAELYHHESSTRGFDDTPEKQARAEKEVAYMWAHWGHILKNDPAYNPNLSLDTEDVTLAWPPRLPEFDQSTVEATSQ